MSRPSCSLSRQAWGKLAGGRFLRSAERHRATDGDRGIHRPVPARSARR